MLAYDYPLLGVLWTLLMVAFGVIVLFAIIWALFDNFRRKDHGGLAKALWFLFIIFFPIIGVFVYLIVRPVEVEVV